MYSKYIVVIDKGISLPSRICLLEDAWGKKVPVSFVQDDEELDAASYLDVKVNKWEANSKWSNMQDEEPWIRIEILRNGNLVNFLSENEFQFSVDSENYFLVVLELDEGWQEIDQVILARLVKIISATHQCYAYDSIGKYVICSDYLKSLPSKERVRQSVFLEA